uniref:EF-1-gamma C-terminal domain-containing protein n=1 Tax=Mesocestoides corti TaxID=53468 RepID=A0A5K3ENB6_MESCO
MTSFPQMLFEHLLDEGARSTYPNVVRWFTAVANQPEVKKVVGEVKLCAKTPVFNPKHAQKQQHQKGGEKKEDKKKQEPKKKEQKPEKPTGGDSGEDEGPPKPSKNPVANLPAGTFNYDEFKKVYSNEDIQSVALPFFWEKFDPTTDSIWYCEYNYPEELKMTFMSANLIRGMFQRLEKMQKYSFAVMNVYGENNKSTIGGVWVWRGTGLIFDLSPDLQVDYESYTWTKLDPEAPDTRARIAPYFCRSDRCDGKEVAETCVFK